MQVKVKAGSASQVAISANRLGDGRVVWLTSDGGWSETVGEAGVWPADAAPAWLDRAAADEAANLVVGAYLLEVKPTDHGAAPLRARERFRAGGPTFALPGAV